MENYFEFYKINQLFFLDEVKLKQQYLKFSKQFHPDFYLDDDTKYAEALHISSLNNTAFKQLKTLTARTEHILKINNVLVGEDNSIAQDFLLQMMDINEAIMELQLEPNECEHNKLCNEIGQLENELNKNLITLAQRADAELEDAVVRFDLLKEIKDIYLKQKYLLRIRESLNTFALL